MNLYFTEDKLVHAYLGESDIAMQTKCYLLSIPEEFRRTSAAITCLECIAEES